MKSSEVYNGKVRVYASVASKQRVSVGDVVLDVTKPTKINHIKIALSGTVQVGSNVLTLFTREDEIASDPNGSHLLEAKSNRFPFELNIPGASAELPTSMKVRKKKRHPTL